MQPTVQTGTFSFGVVHVHRRPFQRVARVRKRQNDPCPRPIATPTTGVGGRNHETKSSAAVTAAPLLVRCRPADGIGGLQLTLFENTVEEKLIQPTFIVDYPTEVSPLARASARNPEVVERFELYIAGREIANGFSELNDPEDQAERFLRQARQKEAGDAEAMHYDADFIRALEYAMPPASGAGIGIDRLVMLFTDSPSIRDVILFPLLRPESG